MGASAARGSTPTPSASFCSYGAFLELPMPPVAKLLCEVHVDDVAALVRVEDLGIHVFELPENCLCSHRLLAPEQSGIVYALHELANLVGEFPKFNIIFHADGGLDVRISECTRAYGAPNGHAFVWGFLDIEIGFDERV